MNVIKLNGTEQAFDFSKIRKSIEAANSNTIQDEQMSEEQVEKTLQTITKKLEGFSTISTDDIGKIVEASLVRHNRYVVAKNYILYRNNKNKESLFTPDEKKILALIDGDTELRGDNANKHIDDNACVRDYIAGISCKSIASKILPQEITEAHNNGLIHWHDMDYSPVEKLHNCDLIDSEDMIDNTFVMGETLIENNEETPFRTACNLEAQINLQVSGRQYGGQTITWSHLLGAVEQSRNYFRRKIKSQWDRRNFKYTEKDLKEEVENSVHEDVVEGVKIYQYQILCHQSSNGQTPFVSNNLCLREAETQQELDDMAMIIEEIFKRRIKGVKDKNGHWTTPLFPKLLYWVSKGLNYDENDKYFYLTKLAAECNAYRSQPDINSEEQCRKIKKGQIIPSMGCRSLLSPIWEENVYPVDTKFYWTEGGTYPYGTFVDKKSFEELPNGTYPSGYEKGKYCINFRGNTGWLIAKDDKTVTIYQPKVYGRWNNGVITINLPHVALEAKETNSISKHFNGSVMSDMEVFYKLLDERLELCRRGLQLRYKRSCEIQAKNSPILWQYGALARMNPEDTIGDFMKKYPKRASISLGYVGLYETCEAMIGQSNTTDDGRKFSKEVLTYMNNKCNQWAIEDGINYSIYGTPEEALTYKFAMANRRDFGFIDKITDKDYVVNSYHVDPREKIDAFSKLAIEGEYLGLSSGGAVSYVETGDLTKNIDVIVKLIQWMHDHILYAEINRIIGICYECGHSGSFKMVKSEDGKFKFICPVCGNSDDNKMNIKGRLCGYLGEINAGNTNKGRLDDIFNRVIHLDVYDEDATQEIMSEIYNFTRFVAE